MRKSWHRYFFDLAKSAAEMATCDRLHAGTVLVKNKRIVAMGFNGSLPGALHCDDVGHLLVEGHCVRTVHSEINAICNAARMGVSTEGSEAYITASPCWNCIKALRNAGVAAIYFDERYKNAESTWPNFVAASERKDESGSMFYQVLISEEKCAER